MQKHDARQSKILLVEDDEDTLHVYATMLRHAGYDVVEAVTGPEGVDRALSEHPDLILMDMNIPTIDGWEAARQIRLDPEAAVIPLVAFSGRVDCVADIRRDDGLFDGFIAKPVSPTDLVRRVRAYVELVAAHAPAR